MSETAPDKLIPEWDLDGDRQIIAIGVIVLFLFLFGGWLLGRGGDEISSAIDDVVDNGGNGAGTTLEERVDALRLDVDAAVDGDDVTLTGDVPTSVEQGAAIAAVTGVEGVGEVIDEMRIVLPDVERAVGEVGAGDIGTSMNGFVAVVEGTVASEGDRDAVVDAAAAVAGVTRVDDRLTVVVPEADPEPVEPTEPEEPEVVTPTTADLQVAVEDVMAGSTPALTGLVEGTTVTVTGIVTDAADRDARLDAAAAIEGVTDVVDETTLLSDEVAAAVAGSGIAGATSSTTGTVATLTGTVANRAEADAAVAAAAAVDGVTSVDDQLVLQTDLIAAELAALQELEPITFTSGSADLTPAATTIVDRAAEILVANPTAVVEIAGHTDDQGPADANQALSQARADTVLAALVERGVAATNLTAVGYGESEPVVADTTPEARAQNRRIEFRVS